MVSAFIEAGVPAEAFGLYPGGHDAGGAIMTKTVGEADYPRHHFVAGLGCDLQFSNTRCDGYLLPIFQLSGFQIFRMHQQGATPFSLHQTVEVVHPGIVGAHVSAPDQFQ